MIEVKPKQIRKTRIVCSHCGSENISVRAEVRWDYATQKWVFDDFMEGFETRRGYTRSRLNGRDPDTVVCTCVPRTGYLAGSYLVRRTLERVGR
jgi:transposase-like protein